MSELTDTQPTVDDDAPVVRARACESCGCPVETWDKFCPACGVEQAVTAEAAAQPVGQKHFRCQNCGAEVAVDPDQRSYACPFCDSTYVVEFDQDTTGRQPPEFVIGFAIAPEQALERYQTWFRSNSWFRPGDLITARVEEKLKGVYLPFWSFSMLARSQWSAGIGEHWYETQHYTTRVNGKTVHKTRRVQHTEWWDLAGKHHRYYSGFLVSGSRGLPQQHAERIKPFHLPALKRYQPYFLAGWLSEEYSLARDEALQVCQAEFYRREQQNVAAHLPGDTHRSVEVATAFSEVNSDLILAPVYLLSYRYRDKLHRFMINGQTGKVYGEKPLSWRRILAAVGITLATVAAVAGLMALLGSILH